jgi:DNA-binding transcriptional MerR regulator
MVELRISELAQRSGVSASALRYYEDIGLLPAGRTPAGYRTYDEHAQERLRFIAAAKRLELPLSAIGELLAVWDSDACRAVKRELRPLLDERIAETDAGLAELGALRETLAEARTRLDALPDREEKCDPACVFLLRPPVPAPIACSLDADAYGERMSQWHRLIGAGEPERTRDAVRLRVPRERAAEVAELVVAEQQCCPFLEFELSFRPAEVVLAITAPADAQGVLDVFARAAVA